MAIGTTAALIGLGVAAAGAGASAYGAAKQSGAMKDAAKMQAGAAVESGEILSEAAEGANVRLNEILGGVNGGLSPYTQAGTQVVPTLAALLGEGGDFNRNFTRADFEADPGYQFRLDEAQKAIERSAAARGGLYSGATLKSLSRYSQGIASEEYDRAFSRFQTDRTNRFGRLFSTATLGLNANEAATRNEITLADMMNRNTMGAAEGRVNAITGAANANAAGKIGAANAWAGGVNGAVNSGISGLSLWQDLKKKP